MERELLDFLLAHHTTDDMLDIDTAKALDRSVDKLNDPDVDEGDKLKFVSKLRTDLERIVRTQKGRPSEEDVAAVVEHFKEFAAARAKAGHLG